MSRHPIAQVCWDDGEDRFYVDARQPGDVAWSGGSSEDLDDIVRWIREVWEDGIMYREVEK